jgi:hypothetical protein
MSVAVPQSVAGDPVTIASGVINIPSPAFTGSGGFHLEGDTFSLAGSFFDGGTTACFPCPAGPTRMQATWGGDMGIGSGTVDGTFYPKLFFAGSFGVGGTVTLPADDRTAFPATFPLTFGFSVDPRSTISGFTDIDDRNRVFTLDLIGSGTAEMTTTRYPPSLEGAALYDTRALSFSFGPNAAPTPEPASLLLVGTALVGSVIARRARRAPRT